MRRPATRSAAQLAGVSAALVLAGVSVASAAGPQSTLRRQVSSLHTRTERAILDLYALDTRLHVAQARLSYLQLQAIRLRDEQLVLAQRILATRRTLNVSQSELGSNLTLLYKRGDVNTLAIVLGARSIDDAVTQLDDLNRVADESKQVVQVATAAQSRLLRLQTSLAAARARTDAAVADARRTAELLAGARAERLAFIGRLRNSERLKKAQIDRLAAVAQRVERKAKALQAAAASTAVESTPTPAVVVAPAPADGRTLTVTSTGYSLPGQTATGAPVGWGVVSVDPAVIPLGTRLTIPGYGEGVAADVGSGVHGSMIDLWFPTPMQAQAWGRRTITITLH